MTVSCGWKFAHKAALTVLTSSSHMGFSRTTKDVHVKLLRVFVFCRRAEGETAGFCV